MTFDKSVPLSEQRLRVANAKPKRKHKKRHGQGDHAKARVKAKNAVKYRNAIKAKLMSRLRESARKYWSGEKDELRP